MAITRPFTDAHAIARVEVGIRLSRHITEEEAKSLSEFALDQLVDVEGGFAEVRVQEGSFPVVILSPDPLEDGSIPEEMFSGRNVVGFRTNEYRGWANLISSVDRRWSLMRPFFDRLDIYVESVGLEYCDQFFSDESTGEFSVFDVFSEGCPYLAPALLECRHSWETRHQWIPDRATEEGLLHILKLSVKPVKMQDKDATNEEKWNLLTEVMHRQHHFAISEDRTYGDRVPETLNELHAGNKRLLATTLNEALIERIGLKEGV